MTLFQYIAVNDDNKEVRGTVEAPSLDAAKRALLDRNLEVTELTEAMRSKAPQASAEPTNQPSLKTTFAFEGTDESGAVKRGTIEAESKYEAFEKLKQGQHLSLAMLSPLGITPQFRDNDLENWQKKPAASQSPVVPAAPKAKAPTPIAFSPITKVTAPPDPTVKANPAPAPVPKRTISFIDTVPAAAQKPVAKKEVNAASRTYHPLTGTLRLYAGWLLAWYGLFVALGYYAYGRVLPFEIPFVEAFFISPLIFSFTVAIFLYLLLTTLHKALHGKLILGSVLGGLGILSFFFVRLSLV